MTSDMQAVQSAKLDALADQVAALDRVLVPSTRDQEMARHFMASPGFERGKAFDFGKQILASAKRDELAADLDLARRQVDNYARNRKLLADAEAKLASLKGKRGLVDFQGGQVKASVLRNLCEAMAADLRRSVSAAERWME